MHDDAHTTFQLMTNVLRIHERDPNFPHVIIENIKDFLSNEDVFDNPEKHETLITEMKLEAALITNNSPYAEVRAVVDNKDDPSMPCSTVRAWAIGVIMSVFLAFVNQLFSIRQPTISISANVAQLLAYPLGKAWERWVPAWEFTLPFLGQRHSLNPGRFNKKEHMLIAIMANTAQSLPYTQYIVWTQVLERYFNQQYARSFAYQILIALSTNFIGYGLAGLTRKFIGMYMPGRESMTLQGQVWLTEFQSIRRTASGLILSSRSHSTQRYTMRATIPFLVLSRGYTACLDTSSSCGLLGPCSSTFGSPIISLRRSQSSAG